MPPDWQRSDFLVDALRATGGPRVAIPPAHGRADYVRLPRESHAMSRLPWCSALTLAFLLSMNAVSWAQEARQASWAVLAYAETVESPRPVTTMRELGIGPLVTVPLILKAGPLADTRSLALYSLPGSDPLPIWRAVTPDRPEPPQLRASIKRASFETPPPEAFIALLQDLETDPDRHRMSTRSPTGIPAASLSGH